MINTKKINYNITFEYTGPHSIRSTVPAGRSISFQIKTDKTHNPDAKAQEVISKKD